MADISQIISQEAINGILKATEAAVALDIALTKIKTGSVSAEEKVRKLSEAEAESSKISKDKEAVMKSLTKEAAAKAKADEKAAKLAAEYSEAIKKEAKSIDDLVKQNKALTAERNKLDSTTKSGARSIQDYNKRIQENTEKIRANSTATEQQRMNIGNYKSALEGVWSKVLAFGGAIGIATTALGLFKEIIFSTRENVNKFKDLVSGTQEAFGYFARSMATANFTNLIQGFKDAYTEGVRYAQALRDISAMQRALGITKADIEGQILDQKLIARQALRLRDTESAEAAVDEIIRLETLKMTETKEVTGKTLKNALDHNRVITKLSDEEIISLVQNTDEVKKQLAEAQKLHLRLQSLIKITYSQVGDQQIQIKDTNEYDAAVKRLTESEKDLLNLREGANVLSTKQRDIIAEAMTADILATNEQKSGMLALERLRGRIMKQLEAEAGIEEKSAAAAEKANDAAEDRVQTYEDLIKAVQAYARAVDEVAEPDVPSDYKPGEDPEIQRILDTQEAAKAAFQQTADYKRDLREQEKADLERYYEMGLIKEEEYQARLKELNQNRVDSTLAIAQQTVSALADIGNTILSFEQARIDQEMVDLDNRYAYETKLAGDNAAAKEAADKKYDKESKRLKNEQAKQNRRTALFNAIIGTAQAIISGLTTQPFMPVGIIMGALAGVLGAVQIGLIASQPLPTYAKGTSRARRGLAVVGEKGRELIMGPDGSMALSPSTASLVNLGSGGQRIIPNRETELLLRAAKGADDQHSRRIMNQIHEDNERLIRTVRDKAELHVHDGGRRIRERKGNFWKTYEDKKIRL